MLRWDYPCCKSKTSFALREHVFYHAARIVLLTFFAKIAPNCVSLATMDIAACMIAEIVQLKIVDTPLMRKLNTF
jgi:hypothetical protein